jgi:hypothetical protein
MCKNYILVNWTMEIIVRINKSLFAIFAASRIISKINYIHFFMLNDKYNALIA